ncbi:MAG: hypothetical protein IIY21_26110 [Clostridiales bacterium]|nr:hypothetical protein [Clostridiales bacterium]MBQ1573109.1 hypothetical protein [Clostridiales bacterium]
MKQKPNKDNLYTAHRMWVAIGLTIFGIALLGLSLFIPPQGEIHPSVLAASGEVFTFSGALFGIKLNFDRRMREYDIELERMRMERMRANDNDSDLD